MPHKYKKNIDNAIELHPDYDVKIWDLDSVLSIDIPFLHEALSEQMWAFATDVIRLFAMSTLGGVYADVDVYFNRYVGDHLPRDGFLVGWECDYLLGPHALASVPGHPFPSQLLDVYRERRFIVDEHHIDCTPLPTLMTWYSQERYGLILDGRRQAFGDGTLILPQEYLTHDVGDGRNVCDHQYDGGWLPSGVSFKQALHNRYQLAKRPSRVLLDAALHLAPRSLRRTAFDLWKARHAYPGAFERKIGELSPKGRVGRAREILAGVVALPHRSPLKAVSRHHMRRRRRPKADLTLIVSTKPSVDVIVPIYGVEAYLPACLSSLERQDYSAMRVLLIDDGSLDRSGQIARAFADRFPDRFEYHRKENGGLGDARNFGLERVQSELVMFVDGDDTASPDFVSSMVGALGHDLDVAICDFDLVTPEGRLLERRVLSMSTSDDPTDQALNSGSECYAWNKIYRTRVFADTPDLRFGLGWFEDLAVVPAILGLSANGIGFVHGPKYQYVQRPTSIIAQSRLKLYKQKDVFDSFALLRRHEGKFIGRRWGRYYDWTLPAHLFLSRAAALRQEADHHKRIDLIREFSSSLNSSMPDWYSTARVKYWKHQPASLFQRWSRTVLVDAYRTGNAELYSTLEGLQQYGM